MPSKHEVVRGLRDLLIDYFTHDEVRRLVADLEHGARISAELPGPGASTVDMATAAVDRMLRHGAVDQSLFDALSRERPIHKARIATLAAAAAEVASTLLRARDDFSGSADVRVNGRRTVDGHVIAHVIADTDEDLHQPLERLLAEDTARPVIVWAERAGQLEPSPANVPPRPEGGRLLLASAIADDAAAACVCAAMEAAMTGGFQPFERERDHVRVPTLVALARALASEPAAAVLLLCDHDAAGLVLVDGEVRHPVAGDALAQTLVVHRTDGSRLHLVVLAPLAATAQEGIDDTIVDAAVALHRAGIPAVIAPCHALPLAALVDGVAALLAALLGDIRRAPRDVLAALVAVHRSLAPHGFTRAGVRLYASAVGPAQHPFVVSPYRGLLAFRVRDQRFFFGRADRESEVLAGLARLAELGKPRLFVVFGPSGSGKSSLVRAGVAARLLGERTAGPPMPTALHGPWQVAHWNPGVDAVSHFEAALATTAAPARRLLLIDPLESILQFPEATRDNLLHALCARVHADGDLWCVVTLREDQLNLCSKLKFGHEPLTGDDQRRVELPFGRFLGDRDHYMLLLPPTTPADFHAAITGPAENTGLELENGLATTIVDDIRGEAGALPLLQYILTRMWEQRRDDSLTIEGYRAIGGRGAIASRADEIYRRLDEPRRSDARRMLLALAATDGDRPTSRTRSLAELMNDVDNPAGLPALIDGFVGARLLVTRQHGPNAVVQVAHEALLREWPEFDRWLAIERHVRPDAERLERWLADAKNALFNANQLAQARVLLDRHGDSLRPSLQQRVRMKLDESTKERRMRRVRSGVFLLFLVAMIVTTVWAIIVYFQKVEIAQEAERLAYDRRNDIFVEHATEALRRGSVSLAVQLLREVDIGERLDAFPGWSARVAEMWQAHDSSATLNPDFRGDFSRVALSPDAARAYTEQHGVMRLWDVASKQVLHKLHVDDADIVHVRFSTDGRRLVREHSGERLVWDVDTGSVLSVQARSDLDLVRYSPDQRRVVVATLDGQARLMDPRTGAEIAILSGHRGRLGPVAFSPDGARLISAAGQLWDGRTGTPLAHLAEYGDTGDHGDDLRHVAFSPDAARIVGVTHRGALRGWDTATGESWLNDAGDGCPIDDLVFYPKGSHFVTRIRHVSATSNDVINIRNAWTGQNIASRTLQDVFRVQPLADTGNLWIDGTWRGFLWTPPPDDQSGHPATSFLGKIREIGDAPTVSPDGSRIVAMSRNGFAVYDAHTGEYEGNGVFHPIMTSPSSLQKLAMDESGGIVVVHLPGDDKLMIYDLLHNRPVNELAVTPRFRSVAMNRDGTRILVADVTVRLQDTTPGGVVVTLADDAQAAATVTFERVPTGEVARIRYVDGTSRDWSARTGKLVLALDHVRRPHAWAYSRDGALLYVDLAGPRAVLWDVTMNQPRVEITEDGGPVEEIVFTPASSPTRIVTTSPTNGTRLRSVADGALLGDPEPPTSDHVPRPSGLALSRDGLQILDMNGKWHMASGWEQGPRGMGAWRHMSEDATRLIDVRGAEVRSMRLRQGRVDSASIELKGHTDAVVDAAFDRHGALVATASKDYTARVWEASDGSTRAVLNGHADSVQAVAFSDDGRHVITGSGDGTARVWDISSDVHPLIRSRVWSGLAVSGDETRFLARDDDGRVRVWDSISGRPVVTLEDFDDDPLDTALSPDGRLAVMQGLSRTTALWDANTGRRLTELSRDPDARAAFAPDGRWLAVSGRSETVVWDTADRRITATWPGTMPTQDPVVAHLDGPRLVTMDGQLARIYDLESGRHIQAIKHEGSDIRWVAGGERVLLIRGERRNLIDVRSAKSLQSMGWILFEAVDGDGTRILVVKSHEFAVWDAYTGRSLPSVKLDGSPTSIALAPDGKKAAFGMPNGQIMLWNLDPTDTASPVVLGDASHHAVGSLAMFADGTRIAAAHVNGPVRIWDLETATLRMSQRPGTRQSWSLEASPKGNWLIGRSDKAHRIWWGAGGESEVPLRMMWSATSECPPIEEVRVQRLGQDLVTARGADDRCKAMVACVAAARVPFAACFRRFHSR